VSGTSSILPRLLLLSGVAVGMLLISRSLLVTEVSRDDAPAMREASDSVAAWFSLVDTLKRHAGIVEELPANIPYRGMIGSEWSEITTTLGSLEAKRTAADPAFAALLVRLLHDAGAGRSSTVGVVLSGSFPSLGLAALAAVQAVGARAVVISSLGSSSFGANQPEVTWLDMESYVASHGGLRYHSAMVTMGAEGDTGGGLSDEGKRMLRSAALRNGVELRTPRSFHEAVSSRLDFLEKARLVINIGGNQASLGMCPHAPVLPHGIITRLPECVHPDRGLIERLLARGIPVIHLLNIEALAAEYHLPLGPATLAPGIGGAVYTTRAVAREPVAAFLTALLAAIVLLRPRRP
jgi:poly-gamma-glutamate system protein